MFCCLWLILKRKKNAVNRNDEQVKPNVDTEATNEAPAALATDQAVVPEQPAKNESPDAETSTNVTALGAYEDSAIALDEAGVANNFGSMPDKDSAFALNEAGVANNFGSMPYGYISVARFYKHPSQNIWKLWYLYYDSTKAWPDMQNEIATVATVEDFREVYNHIKPPSEIQSGCDYSFFKSNIRPMWEDAANMDGGRWVLFLHKGFADDLNKVWENVMLCLIGNVFYYMDEICGAVVSIRGQNNKISIWTSKGYKTDSVLAIGRKILQTLCQGQKNVLIYQLHKHSMAKQGFRNLATYVL